MAFQAAQVSAWLLNERLLNELWPGVGEVLQAARVRVKKLKADKRK